MKRVLNILVAVVTCIIVLAANVLPAFAEPIDESSSVDFLNSDGDIVFSVEADEFNLDDYLIPYDVYYSGGAVSTYSVSEILGFSEIAWGSDFAASGATIAEGGLFALGYLLAADALLYAVDGLIDVFVNDVPQVYADICSLIYINLDEEGRIWFAEAFNLIVDGQPVTVPASLSEQIADIINGLNTTDSEGNLIDTTIIIPEDTIAGVFADTYPARLSFSAFNTGEGEYTNSHRLFQSVKKTSSAPSHSVGNDVITWTSTLDGINTISNNVTGASLSFNLESVIGSPELVRMMSEFFYVTDELGAGYWITYFADNWTTNNSYNAQPFAPSCVSPTYPITFANTGTVLDDLTITGVAWDPAISSWRYSTDEGEDMTIVIDPLGLVLSNTGTKTTVTQPKPPRVNPNKEDKEVSIPWVPLVPDVNNPSIGVPVVDNILGTQAQEVPIYSGGGNTPGDPFNDYFEGSGDEPNKDFNSRNGILNFIGNISNYFNSIFDWLPDNVRSVLYTCLDLLQTIMLLLVVVKIIDIIWP